jgi:F0F1-type ATP synthase membrane subunit b/b'
VTSVEQGTSDDRPRTERPRTLEGLLASFRRVPDGLDPAEVEPYFRRIFEHVAQLEQERQRSSPRYVIESATSAMAELLERTHATAERSARRIERKAKERAEHIRTKALEQTGQVREELREEIRRQVVAEIGDLHRQAQTALEQAQREAELIRAAARSEEALEVEQVRRLRLELEMLVERLRDQSATVPPVAPPVATPPAAPPPEFDPLPMRPVDRLDSAPPRATVPEHLFERARPEPGPPGPPAAEPARSSAPDGDAEPEDRVLGKFKLPRWLDL